MHETAVSVWVLKYTISNYTLFLVNFYDPEANRRESDISSKVPLVGLNR
jgi:hypothetical protein